MKINIALLILIASIITAFQEAEKTVPINDLRKMGVTDWDSSTAGHKPGDLLVNRILIKRDGINSRKDTSEMYDIIFFKNYESNLRKYIFGWGEKTDYDQASYKWMNDSVVAVTLINANTNKKSKTLHIVKIGKTAGIDTKIFDEK